MRFTIGTKLIALISVSLLFSAVAIVTVSYRLFVADNAALIQQINSDTATSLSMQMHETLMGLTEKMRILGVAFLQDFKANGGKETLLNEAYSKDKDFLALYLEEHGTGGTVALKQSVVSPELMTHGDKDGTLSLAAVLKDSGFSRDALSRGDAQVFPVTLPDGMRAIAVAIPFVKSAADANRFSHSLVAIVGQNRFAKAFADNDLVTSYLVDRHGRLLAHPDATLLNGTKSFAQVPIVSLMMQGKFGNGQTQYTDPESGEAKLGAFHVVGFGGLGVVAEEPEENAFAAAKRVGVRAVLVTVAVLCVAFLLGYLFSDTITWPIHQLVEASQRISRGDFEIHLNPRSRDEVADLSRAFNAMAGGLKERDRVKAVFNKFHNKEIAEKLLSGEVKLGGEHLEATILFTDIRGFTAMSEKMTPEAVVEMLNEYMTRMVRVINEHGGVVDKYIGDAIMAIWGVPSPHESDTQRAVRACLAMREELAVLNKLRETRGEATLTIGMGLNSGAVIAGNIGSEEKMDYTVIGDTVNTASRIEAMTKVFGTDFLVDASVLAKVRDLFVFDTAGSGSVKGKTNVLDVYKVLGYIDEAGKQVIVETPYSSYQASSSQKVEGTSLSDAA